MNWLISFSRPFFFRSHCWCSGQWPSLGANTSSTLRHGFQFPANAYARLTGCLTFEMVDQIQQNVYIYIWNSWFFLQANYFADKLHIVHTTNTHIILACVTPMNAHQQQPHGTTAVSGENSGWTASCRHVALHDQRGDGFCTKVLTYLGMDGDLWFYDIPSGYLT